MSSLPPDPYKTLGVSKDAQLPEIRSAHRKLVLKCHPDKVQDPQLKELKQREFQQVQQAYELLSNEAERQRYDDKVKLEELRKDRMTSTTTASPRSSKHHHETKYYDVRTAEPRPTTFGSPPSHNVYGHTPPSRSWDENLYERRYDEKPRYARKTASYEYDRERTRKEDDRRRRDEEKEWARQQEKAREREREERKEREAMKEKEREREKEAKKEKDRRKEERKEDKKKAEKDRRKEAEDKHRRHNKTAYMEPFPGDDTEEAIYTSSSSKQEKKKPSSSSRKYDEVPEEEASHPPLTTERERKNSETLDHALRYLSRSGGKAPPLGRAKTYHADGFAGVKYVAPIAVPTPPPAAASVFAPPPMADARESPLDTDAKRSSARPRRMSHDTHDTPRSSKEKSHKKSSPSKEAIIVDATPSSGARIVPGPSFTKSHSIPISGLSESHRVPPLNRASTDSYTRPQPPNLGRSRTWMPDSDLGRERSRSRHTHMYTSESSDDDREHRHRRTRRTHSPDPMPDIPITTRYTVSSSRKAIPVQDPYFEDSPRSSKKSSHPMPNSSARRADPRQSYEEEVSTFFPAGVKYSKQFDPNEIQFSNLPHSVHPPREEVYT